MVRRRRLLLWCLVAAGLSGPATALGQDGVLRAGVDRTEIRANESFTYILRAEGQLSGRPDFSVLARDFDVLQSSQSSRLQIVNGRTSQVAEWLIGLMPRGPGRFELPPISLDGVQSNSVTLEILPAVVDASADDIFIDVELDRPVSYVQAQAIFTLRLYVGVGTGRATLTEPRISGGEAIVEKLGADNEYQTVRDDRVYNVRERKYAIFPQSPGVLSIGPAVYDAVIYPARGLQRQQRLSSAIVELTVRPAVAPPTSHPSAVWLPAVDLRIEEAWSDDGTAFEQGVPKTRALTVVARGVLETQLPELALAATPGLRQYADQPELSRELTAAGIEARRTERYAVIAQQPGRVELPPLELPWWNVATESWEIARVDAASIEVQPGADSGPVPTSATTAPPAAATDASFWPWLSGALGAGWLATVVAWWFGGRLKRERGAGTPSTRPPSAKGLFRQLAAACRVNDAHRTQELLLSWARLQFADDPPASLGALAARLSGPLAAEIAGLEAALYGPKPAEWRGGPLLTELKAARSVARTGQGDDSDPLVPLYR